MVRLPVGRVVALLLGAATALAGTGGRAEPTDLARGEYLFNAAGCLGCHTDEKNHGQRLAGGRALETPFGTFYSPNITPDRTTGIGSWSDDDFIRALQNGVRLDGAYLYPAFPFPAYTRMTRADALAIKAYLFAQPAVTRANRPHDLTPPFGWRFLMAGWRLLFFTAGPLPPEPARDPVWQRGRYLAEAISHCSECHTPRGWFGDLDNGRAYAGNPALPDGGKAPNLTLDPVAGIGKWSTGDLDSLLELGLTPDGDVVGSSMAEVVRNSTSRLTREDRHAIITYLKALPPLR